MVSNTVLRKVVSTYFFLTPAATNKIFTMSRVFLFLFSPLFFQETATEHLEGSFLILLLATAVLAADNFPRGDMQHLASGVRGVYTLSSRTTSPADFNAQILRENFNINFLCFRKYCYCRCRSMDASLGFSSGHTLHTMNSTFVAQPAKDYLP